jgi:hypothetical protein
MVGGALAEVGGAGAPGEGKGLVEGREHRGPGLGWMPIRGAAGGIAAGWMVCVISISAEAEIAGEGAMGIRGEAEAGAGAGVGT